METTQITYSYDNSDRLISMSTNTGERVVYEYDKVGNRVAETRRDQQGEHSLK